MTDSKRLWWKDGIVYQIYPRSFQDSNNDGIGDLKGITDRLDYIKALGVDAIWLSPVYPSPDCDFGYDVADYVAIDPKYGTMDDFEALLEAAHQRDLHIIMDLVLNHTSDQHEWFIESKKSKDNPYHDWYMWRDPKPDGSQPNNWESIFGGGGWEYDKNLNQYYYHMFAPQQPDLNWRNPDVREAMLNVFRFWLDKGVDGFRLDVFNEYYKHPDYPDLPKRKGFYPRKFDGLVHTHDTSQPEMYPLLREIRKIMDSYPDRYVVGETYLADPAQARTYIGPDKLHAGFDFRYLHSKWGAASFGHAIQYWDALHGDDAWPNYFLNNHDNSRSTTRYKADETDLRTRLLAAMHLTVRGTPYLYYGEEIGMRDITVFPSELQDPVGKRYWPFNKGRDGCRSPMQWDSSNFAGFSESKPWLKVHPNYVHRNVELQEENPNSLLNFYRSLIALRREHAPLHRGDIELLPLYNNNLLAYKRTTEQDQALIVLNFAEKPETYPLPLVERGEWVVIFAGNTPEKSQVADGEIHLPPFGFCILSRVVGSF